MSTEAKSDGHRGHAPQPTLWVPAEGRGRPHPWQREMVAADWLAQPQLCQPQWHLETGTGRRGRCTGPCQPARSHLQLAVTFLWGKPLAACVLLHGGNTGGWRQAVVLVVESGQQGGQVGSPHRRAGQG